MEWYRQFPGLASDSDIARGYRIAMREMFFYWPISVAILLRSAIRNGQGKDE